MKLSYIAFAAVLVSQLSLGSQYQVKKRFAAVLVNQLSLGSQYQVKKEDDRTTLTFEDVKEKELFASNEQVLKKTFSDQVKAQQFFLAGRDSIEVQTSDSEDTLRPQIAGGLLSTMLMAYNNHVPLVLRPDDVWLTVSAVVARYIDKHAEELRDRFVSRSGKKELNLNLPLISMDQALSIMANTIHNNIEDEALKDFFTPNFSTTTPTDRTVSNIQLMAGTKSYFDFKMSFWCGIPKVTLLGTLGDWEELRIKADYIQSLGGDMAKWHGLLARVLDQLVATYKGEVDKDFWQRVFTSALRGSGSTEYNGWSLVFAPFDSDGEYLLNEDATSIAKTHNYAKPNHNGVDEILLQDSMVDVSVTINDKPMIVYAGVSLPKYNKDSNSLSPSVDYALIAKKQWTLEEFHNHVISNNNNIKLKAKYAIVSQFAFHIIKETHLPNQRLTEMAQLIKGFFTTPSGMNYSKRGRWVKELSDEEARLRHPFLYDANLRGLFVTASDKPIAALADWAEDSAFDRTNLQAFCSFLKDKNTHSWIDSPTYIEIHNAVQNAQEDDVIDSFLRTVGM